MSSSAPTKREHVPNSIPQNGGIGPWLKPWIDSTVGNKFLVAISGLALVGFVIGHLAGNLQIFLGQDAINAYARKLQELGPVLWIARMGLLVAFVAHIGLTIRLKIRQRKARPHDYAYPATIQASWAAKNMLILGSVIGLFLLYHLMHFTWGITHRGEALVPGGVVLLADGTVNYEASKIEYCNYMEMVDYQGRHDVYGMVRAGFKAWYIALIYILAQIALAMHLSHGIKSAFQTLGVNSPRFDGLINKAGVALAVLIALGNILIVAGVWFDWVPRMPSFIGTPPNV